jgi:hypothetical protein
MPRNRQPPRSATRHRARKPPVGGNPALCSTPSQRGYPLHLIHHIARYLATRHPAKLAVRDVDAGQHARRKCRCSPRTRRKSICDSRNPSRPSVTAGQPLPITAWFMYTPSRYVMSAWSSYPT